MKILVLNAGSSSQKSCLYQLDPYQLPKTPPHPLWEAQIDWTHQQSIAELKVKTNAGITCQKRISSQCRLQDTEQMLQTLWSGDTQVIDRLGEIDIVGHRVVHGGQEYQQSTLIDAKVKEAIERLSVFAPVHNPINLAGIKIIEKLLGNIPQVAVFDTAFHSQLPPEAYVYPVPYEWLEQGIRRYGFHGISHKYCAHRAAQLLGKDLLKLRLITCHLGNGCSLAAILDGHSVDTTMGFTPLEGLMMGSRSGSIDPGIIIHLLKKGKYTPDEIDNLLNHHSGLLGVSGISEDLRQIVSKIEQGDRKAKLALEIYLHYLRAQIAAMIPSLGGLDALIFTAGVGENSAIVRASVCEKLAFLGLKIDLDRNNSSPVDVDIAVSDSNIRVLVIHTEEDWAIAQECCKFLQ